MDSVQTLGKKPKSSWFSDTADLFVLSCSFLLTAVSIALVALIFYIQANFAWESIPSNTLSILQRTISALSAVIASAMIVVAGKRYVLFKFATGGIRSRRVSVYASPSIGNLARYLVWYGFELPLLGLLVVWALGLATGLTVGDAWAMLPTMQPIFLTIPFGPFDTPVTPGSLVVPASGQLSYAIASLCSGVAGIVGLIEIGSDMQLSSGGPAGVLYYPPLLNVIPGGDFSLSTSLNGFNISTEPLSSVPSTAQNLTCGAGQLWYESGDNQTLSIIVTLPQSSSLYRLNASAIILAGTLQSTANATEFLPNGTSWPNVMPNNQWAQDIIDLVCNVTYPVASSCSGGTSLIDFAIALNAEYDGLSLFGTDSSTAAGIYWSTALGMAMGAYSAAYQPLIGATLLVTVTRHDALQFTVCYGLYVLIANVVVSIVMFVVVVKLRVASHLGGDFINTARLLLDPLKRPELFDASLDATVDALGNPYMLVNEENVFQVADALWDKTKKYDSDRTSLASTSSTS